MIAAPCSSCTRAVRVLVTMRSPRGPYQLCARCLGPDAAPPTPTSDAEIAERKARAAAVSDALAWFDEHAERLGWAPPPTRAPRRPDHDTGHNQRGQA